MSVISVDLLRPARPDQKTAEHPKIDLVASLMLALTALGLTAFWIGVFLFLIPALVR